MLNDIVMCATRRELSELDLTNLRMHGITSTQFVSESVQLLLETDINTLVISSLVIEEQSTEDKFLEDLKIIYNLKKRLRIIYIKPNVQLDKIITLMDENNNWDVYYNTRLENLQPDVFVKIIQTIKKPTNISLEKQYKSSTLEIDTNADYFSTKVIETKSSTISLSENIEFNTLVRLNGPFIMDLAFSYKNIKDQLNDSKKTEEEFKKKYLIQTQEVTKLKEELTTVGILNSKLHEDNSELKRTLHIIQSKFNRLVEKLKDIINITNLNTLFTNTLDTGDYANNAPIVIYFKEYSKVKYFTDFIINFNSLLNSAIGLSKILVIENDDKRFKFPLYEDKEFVEVYEGENMGKITLANLVTFGNNLKLNKYLLLNSLRLDFLIIVDRTNHYEDLIVGDNVIRFDLISNEEEKTILGLDSIVITNDAKSKYCLEEIKDFHKIKQDRDLINSAMISLELTKKLSQFIISWRDMNARQLGGE